MPQEELTEAASAAKPVRQVVGLVRWVGEGRKLTQTGRLTMNDARALVELLETGDDIDRRIGDSDLTFDGPDNVTVTPWASLVLAATGTGGDGGRARRHPCTRFSRADRPGKSCVQGRAEGDPPTLPFAR